MSKLTEKERVAFEKIMNEDLNAINARLMTQIKDFWAKARQEVLKRKGHDKLIARKKELQEQINLAKEEIDKIEHELNSDKLRPEQVVELGGKPNEYGRYKGAGFYDIPVESQFEYEIVEYIRENIDLQIPVKFIHDLGRACMRELAMSGTFEEARKAYGKFYSLDFKKYGVDIPPRLDEIKKHASLLGTTQEMLRLENKAKNDSAQTY